MQAVTGAVFLTFILGTFYRSASLYHPQRRAILHLKNQKRKIKDKNKVEDRPAFLDTSTLRSKTVRILLASTGLSAFGINTPIFYLVSPIPKRKNGGNQQVTLIVSITLDRLAKRKKKDWEKGPCFFKLI